MKKKQLLLAAFALAFSTGIHAQAYGGQTPGGTLDADEDTSQVTTVDDIIAMQQKVSISSGTEKHYDDVWARRKYRNIGYNSTKLESSDKVDIGSAADMQGLMLNFKSDWGVNIELGTNYRLHKPISNMVSINFDYTWFDLNINHFKAESFPAAYDVEDRTPSDDHYVPWTLEKYEADYGMMIGPSVTVAPLVNTSSQAAHFLKLQAYFHLGFRVSGFYIPKDDKRYDTKISEDMDEDDIGEIFKGGWGTGFYTKFGFNVSWKFIGLGYEYSSGGIKYKPFSSDTFGKKKEKFDLSSSRFFIQFRF